MSCREGFCPESVRKTADRCAASSLSSRIQSGMRSASTAAYSRNFSQSFESGLSPSYFVLLRRCAHYAHRCG
jgi:hypothetical protein